MSSTEATRLAAAAERKAQTRAQEAAGLVCPLTSAPEGGCQLSASLEISGERGIVQVTCAACGGGCAKSLPLPVAQALLAEIHAHQPPPPVPPEDPKPKKRK